MGRINQLDKALSDLIAAGEVVDRPASAVKELVENAADAAASSILVEIKSGGMSYIRVTDNGCGMDWEDAKLCFARHATSKIKKSEDLASISTLGFRGEALCAIAAVSKVELYTRERGSTHGTHVRVEGGEIILCEEAGCPEGTTITVRELYYNTPARLKFIKRDATEAAYVSGAVQRMALARPDISLRLIRDMSEELHTLGDNLSGAIYCTLGRDFLKSLIVTDYKYNNIEINGYISHPLSARANRNMQYFFINGRPIKSKVIGGALEEGFKGSLPAGRFPSCVLHVRINERMVDVNVHPAKTEVKFVNDQGLYDAVYFAVRSSLDREDGPFTEKEKYTVQATKSGVTFKGDKPVTPFRQEGMAYNKSEPSLPRVLSQEIVQTTLTEKKLPVQSSSKSVFVEYAPPKVIFREPEEIAKSENLPSEVTEEEQEAATEGWRFAGELFSTYVLFEKDDNVLVLDKHAAHERLIYERLKSERERAAQGLLASVIVPLSREEQDAALKNRDTFWSLGFEIDEFDGGIAVRSAPMEVLIEDIPAVIEEIAGELLRCKNDLTPQLLDKLMFSVACRAAIKAGDRSFPEELSSLLALALKENVKYCPHGRPISFYLTKFELQKRFKRV